MSNENLDHDALATEEMLKMFEGIDIDDALDTDDNMALEASSPDSVDDDALELSESLETFAQADDADELPEMSLANTSEAEILEIAEDDETMQVLDTLESLEGMDDLSDMETDENPAEALSDMIQQEEDATPLSSETLETPAEVQPATSDASVDQSLPIAEHLQAVVANAIQALQDWVELRQMGEQKGPQQSLAQLDVLLDTVTHQQQQLADQLSHSAQKTLVQLSSALGVKLASPQTLGWSADEWRVKAQQVTEKTDDISSRNAKIREELARL